MDRQPPAEFVVGLLAEKVEKLRVDHRNEEIEGAVRIRHDEEQRRFCFVLAAAAEPVELELVVGRDFPQLLNVERCQPRAAGDEDGLGCFPRRQFVFFILPDGEVVRVLLFECVEEDVDGVLEVLVVLADLGGVDHLDERGEVLFLRRRFVPDVADVGRVEQRLGLDPEVLAGFVLALGVGDQRSDELQDVLLRMDVGEGIVVHGLFEIDGVEHLDAVAVSLEQLSAFDEHLPLRVGDHI